MSDRLILLDGLTDDEYNAIAALASERDELKAENARLRQALCEFSRHHEDCFITMGKCTCGLSELLEQNDG